MPTIPDVYHPGRTVVSVRPRLLQKETPQQSYAEILHQGLEEAVSNRDYSRTIPLFSSYTDGSGQLIINPLLGVLERTKKGRNFSNADRNSRRKAVNEFVHTQTGLVLDQKLEGEVDVPFKGVDGWRIIITSHRAMVLNTVRLERVPKPDNP